MLYEHDPAEEATCEDQHKTLECVCMSCGKPGDAICPHCHSELGPDSPVEDYGFRPSTPQQLLAKFAEWARELTSSRNAKFQLACFLVAAGDVNLDGISMTDIAKEWNVNKATVSKQCVAICARLGIPPSRWMKDIEAKQSYRNRNVRKTKTT